MYFSKQGKRLGSLSLLCILLLVACAKGKEPKDPFENYNRKVYAVNQVFDKIFLKPAAQVYVKIIPNPIRTGVANVFNNLDDITVIANDILQGEIHQAGKDLTRFTINTTMGIAGIFDVASTLGLPKETNDLGITLARWGDVNSPYLVMPLFGPATVRDAYGLSFDYTLFTVFPHINPRRLLFRFFFGFCFF